MPSNPEDAKGLMLSAIADPDPVMFVECTRAYFTPYETPVKVAPIPLGKAKVTRQGTDVTIISYSEIFLRATAAADELAKEGISVELIDLRTISPWDRETVIASVSKTGRAVIAHEAVKQFGVGAEIAATLQDELFGQLKAPIKRLGAPFTSVPFSGVLEQAFIVSVADIVAAARATLK